MKKILFLTFITLVLNTKAQIVFEFDHDSASTIGGVISSSGIVQNQLMIVNFEVSGPQYVKINRNGKNISIYDMSHALVKTISTAGFPIDGTGINHSGFLYFSQQLFNTDSKIEFMYCYEYTDSHTNLQYGTNIYNEDGTALFADTAYPAILMNIALQQYPIYNTPNGTKMILSYRNGHAKVFGLSGTLTTAIDRTSNSFSGNMGNAYPNPTNQLTTIEYKLPDNINQGEIVFYDLQGTEIKRFKVDKTFNSLLISTTDIPTGTYYYQLQTAGNTSAAKKLIIVK